MKCVFQGHYHEGDYSEINGIHCYTLRSFIEGEIPEGSIYAFVTASETTIKIHGIRKAVQMDLLLQK